MGRTKGSFQDRDYVLSWFGSKEGEARKAYRRYVEEGISQRKEQGLIGDREKRPFVGWSAVLSMRRSEKEEWADRRILGAGHFVEKILKEAGRERPVFPELKRKIRETLERICMEKGATIEELRKGSRRGPLPRLDLRLP